MLNHHNQLTQCAINISEKKFVNEPGNWYIRWATESAIGMVDGIPVVVRVVDQTVPTSKGYSQRDSSFVFPVIASPHPFLRIGPPHKPPLHTCLAAGNDDRSTTISRLHTIPLDDNGASPFPVLRYYALRVTPCHLTEVWWILALHSYMAYAPMTNASAPPPRPHRISPVPPQSPPLVIMYCIWPSSWCWQCSIWDRPSGLRAHQHNVLLLTDERTPHIMYCLWQSSGQ